METFFNISKAIGFMIDRMDVKSGEKVLVYCEAEKSKIGHMLASESIRRGAKTILALGVAHTQHAQEPPEQVAEGMKVSDVVFCVTQKSMGHTDARTEAIKRGTRFGRKKIFINRHS
jgi:aminopeptidase